jgi:hypothetical protein
VSPAPCGASPGSLASRIRQGTSDARSAEAPGRNQRKSTKIKQKQRKSKKINEIDRKSMNIKENQ